MTSFDTLEKLSANFALATFTTLVYLILHMSGAPNNCSRETPHRDHFKITPKRRDDPDASNSLSILFLLFPLLSEDNRLTNADVSGQA